MRLKKKGLRRKEHRDHFHCSYPNYNFQGRPPLPKRRCSWEHETLEEVWDHYGAIEGDALDAVRCEGECDEKERLLREEREKWLRREREKQASVTRL